MAMLFYIVVAILCSPATTLKMKLYSMQESWLQLDSCIYLSAYISIYLHIYMYALPSILGGRLWENSSLFATVFLNLAELRTQLTCLSVTKYIWKEIGT